jgi:ABC-2 type transport system permease protein
MIERLRWGLHDGWAVTRRDLLHWVSQPWAFALGMLFPVLIVLMFAYILGGSMVVPGGGDYKDFLLPGMFALTMVFGLEATVTSVTTDLNRGVTDRFRSMPIASSAVVLGRSTADMLNSVAGLLIMILCGLAVGWRWHGGIGRALAAVGLLLLLRFAMLWLGIWLALLFQRPEAVNAVLILVWPIGFLSNVYAAPEAMPAWLGAIAEWNPLSSTAAAVRELFGNPGTGGDSWPTQHAVLLAVVWPVLLTAVFFPLSVRRYRGLSG